MSGEYECPDCGQRSLDIEFTVEPTEYENGYLFLRGGITVQNWSTSCGCELTDGLVESAAEMEAIARGQLSEDGEVPVLHFSRLL
jgi:hypothetical protein